jgi:hypothetical protein
LNTSSSPRSSEPPEEVLGQAGFGHVGEYEFTELLVGNSGTMEELLKGHLKRMGR